MEWKTAWSYLPINHNTCIGTVKNITQRAFIRNNLNGSKIKIRFSNLYSEKPIVINNTVIAKRKSTGTEIQGSRAVTYHGNEKILVQPGEEFYSDEMDFTLSQNEDIVLSIYVEEETEICSVCSTWAARSWYTGYGLNGNFTWAQDFSETDSVDVFPVLRYDQNKATNLFGFTEIKVLSDSNVKTVSLFGDSITHMSYYNDALIEKLFPLYPGEVTVLNRGIGGNRLLRDYSRMADIPGGGTIFGHAGVERFYHDVYCAERPDFVLVLIGINDFAHPYVLKHYDEVVTAEEYQNGMNALAGIAHENGSKILFGTVMPFRNTETDWFEKPEELRQRANAWIRAQKISDGIMDFDLAVRKAQAPEYMMEDCHLGDCLHPNTLGGRKMADAVPLEWFR